MKIIKRDSELGTKDIYIKKDNKELIILFGGNGDLYWIIRGEENIKNEFIIDKENATLFLLFETLYNDIENINVALDDEDKELYRKYNIGNYNELFNKRDKTITWYSDETAHQVANILKIIKQKESYLLEFSRQPYIEGYDMEMNFEGSISIRFRNSGSSYNPFNISFMKMFNKLQEIDDINDINHQIHIDEYVYKLKK